MTLKFASSFLTGSKSPSSSTRSLFISFASELLRKLSLYKNLLLVSLSSSPEKKKMKASLHITKS